METVAHILVVDDEPDLRDVLRILLEANHYRVTEAANAEQALAPGSVGPNDPTGAAGCHVAGPVRCGNLQANPRDDQYPGDLPDGAQQRPGQGTRPIEAAETTICPSRFPVQSFF